MYYAQEEEDLEILITQIPGNRLNCEDSSKSRWEREQNKASVFQ